MKFHPLNVLQELLLVEITLRFCGEITGITSCTAAGAG